VSDRPPKAILTLEEAAAQPLRVGPHRGSHRAGSGDAHRDPSGQGGGAGRPGQLGRARVHRPQGGQHIRELEGLHSIESSPTPAWAQSPITIELAQAVSSSNVLLHPKKRQVTPERITRAVADYYGVPMDALKGQNATRRSLCPRQIRDVLDARGIRTSRLTSNRAELGDVDHSTVLHALRNRSIARWASTTSLRWELAAVRELIYADLGGALEA